jgi:membrane protease subunit HflC
MRRIILALFATIVVLVLFVVLCTFVKRPYEKILLSRFGTLIPESQQVKIANNWFFKLPTDTVIPIDTRLHLYSSPLKEASTANKDALVIIRTFAAWRIVDPEKFYRTTNGGSDEQASRTMDLVIQGLVPGKIVNHQLDELFNSDETKIHTSQIEAEIAKEATDGYGATPGLREMGIEIVEIGFSRMAFPPNNAMAVYNRMVAELNKRAIDYQSQGVARANEIQSQGIQDAAAIRNNAVQDAGRIRGEGDAEALRVLAEVQNTPAAREFYQYWKRLDFLKTSLSKNTILVLSSSSELLKTLFQAPLPVGAMPQQTAAPATPEKPADVPPLQAIPLSSQSK